MIFNILKRAADLFYNNKDSGLESTNVQGAIDEVSSHRVIDRYVSGDITVTKYSDGYMEMVGEARLAASRAYASISLPEPFVSVAVRIIAVMNYSPSFTTLGTCIGNMVAEQSLTIYGRDLAGNIPTTAWCTHYKIEGWWK